MGLFYLDSVLPIYLIDGQSEFQARAIARYRALIASGMTPAASDLTRLECLVKPLRDRDDIKLAEFEVFFQGVSSVPLTSNVFDRAAHLRAEFRFKLADALHLAAAIEAGCERFLTNDGDLSRFPDLPIEILA